jgi:hypothetical protein
MAVPEALSAFHPPTRVDRRRCAERSGMASWLHSQYEIHTLMF